MPVYTITYVTKNVTLSFYVFFFSETSPVSILLFLWFLSQYVSDFESMFSPYKKILYETDFLFCLVKDFSDYQHKHTVKSFIFYI